MYFAAGMLWYALWLHKGTPESKGHNVLGMFFAPFCMLMVFSELFMLFLGAYLGVGFSIASLSCFLPKGSFPWTFLVAQPLAVYAQYIVLTKVLRFR
jgi:hypothetical protein